MAQLVSTGQITIVDVGDYTSTGLLPPSNPIKDQSIWIDTSVTPPIQKIWNGTAWVIVNEVNVGERNLFKYSTLGRYVGGLIYPKTTAYSVDGNIINVTSSPGDLVGNIIDVTGCSKITYSGKTNLPLQKVYYNFITGLGAGSIGVTTKPDGSFEHTFDVPSNATFLNIGIGIYPFATPFFLKEIKFEKGSKATPWIWAIEDIDAAILTAQNSANDANTLLTEIASDAKLSPSEKQDTKKEWDIIVGEKPKLEASALEFGVSSTAYTNSYNALNTYLSPLISNLTTTSDIVGATFRSTFKAYYDAKIDLLNAIASKGKLNDQVVVIDAYTKKFINVASFNSQAASSIGYLVITSPITISKMVQLSLSGFLYVGSNIGSGVFKLDISAYQAAGFSTLGYVQSGTLTIPKVQVAKTVLASGQLVYILGLATTKWAYPKVNIDQVIVGYQATPDSYKDGWSIEIKSDISMYFNVTDVPGSNLVADITTAQTTATNVDNLITDIASDLKITPTEKISLKREYDSIVAEKPSVESQATPYLVSVTAFNTAYTNLVNYVNPLLTSLTTTQAVDGPTLRSRFATYYSEKVKVLQLISVKVTSEFSAVRGEIQDVTTAVGNLNTYVDGAFKNGIIDSAEAVAIEKYINSVNTEKSDVQSKYNSVYNDSYLTGTPKSNLLSAWTTYGTSHTNLINSINTAIADKKTTVTEKQDVDVKFALYNNALSVLTTRFQEAITAIDKAKIDAIQIGGRNLILKSETHGYGKSVHNCETGFENLDYFGKIISTLRIIYNGTVSNFFRIENIIRKPNTQYTFSCWLTRTGGGLVDFKIMERDIILETYSVSGWTRVEVTFTSGADISVYDFIQISSSFLGGGGNAVWMAYPQLEEGTKASDWSSAPEDVQAEIDGIQFGGRNYVRNSKITPTSAFYWAGGTGTFVNDAKFGNVLEYSRPAGGGDYQVLFTPIVDSLFNTELVFFVIAKVMASNSYFRFGGYPDTVSAVNSDESNQIDLGDGWKMYWSTFKSGSTLGPNAFGINSVKGTWRFYAVGIQKGNKPSDWEAAPEDAEAEIALAKSQAQNAQNTANIAASVTSFLDGTSDGNVTATGTLLVGDVVGANAGVTGVTDSSDPVRFWAGATYANRHTSPWRTHESGFQRGNHQSGNKPLAFEWGVDPNGTPVLDFYHVSGFKTFTLDPNRGLVAVNYIPESWTYIWLLSIGQSSATLNSATAITFLKTKITQDSFYENSGTLDQVEIKNFFMSRDTATLYYDYQNGTHPNNAQYASLLGYKTTFNNRTANIPNGWYAMSFEFLGGFRRPPQNNVSVEYALYYILDGKVNKTQMVTLTLY